VLAAAAGAGSYRVHARYLGDPHFNLGEGVVDQTVNRADTTTTLTASANPVEPGQNLVLTALVAVNPPGDVPTFGSLQLTVDGKPLGNPMPLDGNVGVRVTLKAPSVPTTNTIGVAYSGDDNTNPSSASLRMIVGTGGGVTSAQQLRELGSGLMKALRSRGFAALSGIAEPFTAVQSGVLEQLIYSPKAPRSATTIAAKRPVVISRGRHSFSRGGAAVLKLRLTAAGRRAIRHAKKLQIAIVTRFTPTNGTPVTVVQRLTVKAKKGGKVAAAVPGWSLSGVRRVGGAP